MSERPRPAPPTITITLDKTTVASRSNPPDTLLVTVRVVDPDGVDSAWVRLDDEPAVGADGFRDTSLEGSFPLLVPPNLATGGALSVIVRARDLDGLEARRDTTVAVGP